MTPLEQQPTPRLMNRRAELWEIIRQKCPPGLVNEFTMVDQIIKGREADGDKSFAQYASKPKTAILALFIELGGERVVLSVQEMWDALAARGYPVSTSPDKALIRDAVNRMLKSKNLDKTNKLEGSLMKVKLAPGALSRVTGL